jgi:DNA-directed RNA polymerase alpha subunit
VLLGDGIQLFDNPWAGRALTAEGYTSLEQLTQRTSAELGLLHGVGPKPVKLLREALAERGLSFANEEPQRS